MMTITVNPLPGCGRRSWIRILGRLCHRVGCFRAVDYEWSPAVGLSDPGIADPEMYRG